MDENVSLDTAAKQLDRIFGFFSRVEAKASFLFAMDTGLLAVMALNFQLADIRVWFLAAPAAAALMPILASICFIYRCTVPNLNGGAASLVYFREIAKRTEANFITAFTKQSVEEHTRDLLGQVWRNSEILAVKFDNIKYAFICTAFAIVPWGIFLAVSSFHHTGGLVVK